jgi:hypothetical protein
MKTVFLRILEPPPDKKGAALLDAIVNSQSDVRFDVQHDELSSVPRSPFAYWVTPRMRRVFRAAKRFEADDRIVKQGLATADDFRFVRHWCEVLPATMRTRWFPFTKGGRFAPFYSDVALVVDWESDGRLLRSFINASGRQASRTQNVDFYFQPGLTWPLRGVRYSAQIVPQGCIFSIAGKMAFAPQEQLLWLSALLNSLAFDSFIAFFAGKVGGVQYEVGLIQNVPVPSADMHEATELAEAARESWRLKRALDSRVETSHAFRLPAILQTGEGDLSGRALAWGNLVSAAEQDISELQLRVDERCFALFGMSEEDQHSVRVAFGAVEEPTPADDAELDDSDGGPSDDEVDAAPMVASLLSWSVGVAFGRFDVRLATGQRAVPPDPEPLAPLPVCAFGMLAGDDGLPLHTPPAGYPLTFPTHGILVDDPGHPCDLERAVRSVFDTVFDDADARWHEAAELLGASELRTWLARNFFEPHIQRYSKSRRKAPIYWQLATAAGSYSVWLYIHRATSDTLFRVLNDFVGPKLGHEKAKLHRLTQEAGGNPAAAQRREIELQEGLVGELHALKAEVARVAPLWKPNLDDGVILNFAPLWRLVPQSRRWQVECKKAWDKLVAGDYDWAHLAMHLWPERVVPKCIDDRSLAIAHGLETALWREAADGTWEPKKVGADEVAALVAERTSAAVKAALKSLLGASAPVAGGAGGARRRVPKRRATSPPSTSSPRGSNARSESQHGDQSAAVLEVVAAHPSGASKSDVLDALGLTDSQWSAVIKVLLASGSVTKTGERRGARYHAKRGDS